VASLKSLLGAERMLQVLRDEPKVLRARSARLQQVMAVLDELLGRPKAVKAVLRSPIVLTAHAPSMWEAHSALVGLLGEAQAKSLVAKAVLVLRLKPANIYATMSELGELVGAEHVGEFALANPEALTSDLTDLQAEMARLEVRESGGGGGASHPLYFGESGGMECAL